MGQLEDYQEIAATLEDLRREHGSVAFLYPDWKIKPFPKQQYFFESVKELAMFSGAQGSGKTKILMDWLAAMALKVHPTIKIKGDVHLWGVGLSFSKVEQVLIPYFLKALPYGVVIEKDMSSFTFKIAAVDGTVSTVSFMSCEADIEKFQSNRLDGIGFDEAPTKPRGVKIFRESLSRFKPNRKLYIRLAGTPWELPRFFRDTFFIGSQADPEHVDCTIVGLADNPYIPPEQVAYQASKYVGKELRARIYGEFVTLQGLVFDTFDVAHHMIDDFPIPDTWPRFCGIDPTEGRRAWTIVWFAIGPTGDHYVYKELEIAGTYRDIVNAIMFKEGDDEPQYRAIDPFAAKFNMATGDEWINDLKKLGLFTKKVDRSKRSQNRSYLSQLLGDPSSGRKPRLFLFKRGAYKTAMSLLNHEWEEWPTGAEDRPKREKEADDKEKDFVDALLYAIAFKPKFFNVAVYKEKRRLRRENVRDEGGLDDTFGY